MAVTGGEKGDEWEVEEGEEEMETENEEEKLRGRLKARRQNYV